MMKFILGIFIGFAIGALWFGNTQRNRNLICAKLPEVTKCEERISSNTTNKEKVET